VTILADQVQDPRPEQDVDNLDEKHENRAGNAGRKQPHLINAGVA